MRWLVRIIGAVAVLVAIGVGLVMLIPTDRVAQMASEKFHSLTGRQLTIAGGVSPRFWPVLGVTTGPITIANADWSQSDQPMLKAESLTIAINAASLFGGDLQILGLTASRPELLLERSKDGRENWVFGPEGGKAKGTAPADSSPDSSPEISPETPGAKRGYSLENGLIQGGSLHFIDHGAGLDLRFDAVEMALTIPDYSGPFSLTASAITQGQKIGLGLEGGAFAAFAEGRVVPVTLSAAVGGTTARFEGRGGWQPMVAEGNLTADLADVTALAQLVGSTAASPPQGFGAQALAVSGQFTLDPSGAAYLRQARIEADGNLLVGDLDLVPGKDRPKLSGNLRAGALDLAGLSGGTGGGKDGGMQATGWPKEPLDVSALAAVDAALTLVAESLDLGAIKLGASRLVLTLERARAVFDIREMAAYGGSVKGEFVVNGRGGLSVGGKLSLANLQAEPLLLDLAGWDRLSAAGNLTLSFLAVGTTVDALMHSLQGEGNLTLGQGELKGLDIAGMLRTLDASYVGSGQKTIFDGIAGSFTMAGGVLSNSDLKLMAPYLSATGAGQVGLGERNLDYRIRPTAFPGAAGTGGVMVPLRITGAWADPTYRLDLEGIAREKMEAEAKAAEARLKAEAAAAAAQAKLALEEKLRRELGVQTAPDEKLEDAAKRRAREAMGKEAGKLLNGLLGGD